LLFAWSCSSVNHQTLNSNSTSANKGDEYFQLYHQGQMFYLKKNYQKALPIFLNFINSTRDDLANRKQLLNAIDQVSRIYLREYKDPEKVIIFLQGFDHDNRLNDAERDVISEWISVSRAWKKSGKMSHSIKSGSELYRLGAKYYKEGMKKLRYPEDDSGNANFQIAATYLIPYIYNFSNGKNIGSALFMMGNIHYRSWVDREYWTDNFYLKEAIRRFPHTALSRKSYMALKESIHFAYSGSSGDYTPPSQLAMLKEMKRLALPLQSHK